jgi:hypothetical protein
MFIIWRRFVSWLRNLLLKLHRKQKVKWDEEIIEVVDIVHDALNKQQPSEPSNTKPNEPKDEPKNGPKLRPKNESKPPKYDIIGDVPKEKRRFFRFFGRK